jgi:hypothetical protein
MTREDLELQRAITEDRHIWRKWARTATTSVYPAPLWHIAGVERPLLSDGEHIEVIQARPQINGQLQTSPLIGWTFLSASFPMYDKQFHGAYINLSFPYEKVYGVQNNRKRDKESDPKITKARTHNNR